MGVTETNLGELVQRPEKPIYWHQVVVEASVVFTAGTQQGVQVTNAQKVHSQWFSGKDF